MRIKPFVDPQQKFFRLCIDGLNQVEGVDVEVLSALPVSASTVKEKVFSYETETTPEGVKYHYLPFKNGKFSRYISLLWATRKYIKKWYQKNKSQEIYIIVDSLVSVIAIPAKRIAKKLGLPIGAIVTDIPTLCTDMKQIKENKIKKMFVSTYQKISNWDLKSYDFYIPLTESINDVVNIHQKPYCIIEGFANSTDVEISNTHENYIMYAGGVYAKYGVKALVEAFVRLDTEQFELLIFGNGSYVDELLLVCEKHPNIKYMGCVSSEEVVKYEKKAFLLVNPRPTDEEFSKYSFPSKTMEYLLSGTAVVSTRLPGIPEEYFNYMYMFNDDSTEGILQTLARVLDYPRDNVLAMGQRGHDFVLQQKNNVIMAKKIGDFLKKIKYGQVN